MWVADGRKIKQVTLQPHWASESAAQKVPESIEFSSFHLLFAGRKEKKKSNQWRRQRRQPAVSIELLCRFLSVLYASRMYQSVIFDVASSFIPTWIRWSWRGNMFSVSFSIIFSQLPRNLTQLNCTTTDWCCCSKEWHVRRPYRSRLPFRTPLVRTRSRINFHTRQTDLALTSAVAGFSKTNNMSLPAPTTAWWCLDTGCSYRVVWGAWAVLW